MSSGTRSLLAITLGTVAVLGTLTLAYGLVYPSSAQGSKAPLFWAIFGGAICVQLAVLIGLDAHRRAQREAESFFALLALILGGFFLFVVALGFGIPALVVGVHD